MIGFPIDSHVTFDDDNLPEYDRAITSAPYRRLLNSLFTSGVSTYPEDGFLVEPDNGLTVHVKPGFAIVNGCLKLEEELRALTVAAAHESLPRIDRVVIRLDDNDDVRVCDLFLRRGTPAADPVPPELMRIGTVWELGIADIYVRAGADAITDEDITDTRRDPDLCGKVDTKATIPVDAFLSSTSVNPVENRVINQAITEITENVNVKVVDFDEETQTLWLEGIGEI